MLIGDAYKSPMTTGNVTFSDASYEKRYQTIASERL